MVTKDEVMAVLGDADPMSTSAAKLRVALRRGSFETIQKHLDAIRATRTQTQATDAAIIARNKLAEAFIELSGRTLDTRKRSEGY